MLVTQCVRLLVTPWTVAFQELGPWNFPGKNTGVSSHPTFNLSQHQGLFKCVSSLHQVAKVLGVSALASVLPTNNQD